MFEKLDKIKPVYDAIYKVCLFLCKLLLIADILITSMAVAGRYISFIPDPAWSEEVVLTLMSYMAVLSAALAIRKGSHIRMTAFDRYLPEKLLILLDLLADVMVTVLAVVMVVVGWQYASGLGAKASYISMPWLSKFWMYAPIPLAGLFMLVFEIEAVYNHIKRWCGKEVRL
ncbi:MAG: TRAP transporter small permease subunit [Lachnospiraceae bacterium]|nr:TRAP transporter small permease subunit [Lachnospiraceae bacterium]